MDAAEEMHTDKLLEVDQTQKSDIEKEEAVEIATQAFAMLSKDRE